MLGSVGLNSVLQCMGLDSLEKQGGEKGRKEQRRKAKEGKREEKERKEESGIIQPGQPYACLPSFLTPVMYDHEPAGRMGTRREGGRDFIFKVHMVPSFVHATQCHCYLEYFTPY